MGGYRDEQMFREMDMRTSGYTDGVSEESNRVAHFLGVSIETINGIDLIDTEKRLESLSAIVAGAQLKIEEITAETVQSNDVQTNGVGEG